LSKKSRPAVSSLRNKKVTINVFDPNYCQRDAYMIKPSKMLRNKTTPLPLHHGGNNSNGVGGGSSTAHNAAANMSAVLEKGLNMAGLATTKVGSGEKERAYVIKQNSVLKALLCLVVLSFLVLVVIFSTVFELKVARRGLIISEAVHHKKEHHDHEELIKTSLELQQALESQIEENSLVEEFRAFFDKAVGQSDDTIDKLFVDASQSTNGGIPPQVITKIKSHQRRFVKSVEIRLAKIMNRFHKKAAEAREKVVRLAQQIGREIDVDAKEGKKYEERLQELGVDEEYAEKLEEQYEEEEDDSEDDGIPGEELTEEEKKLSKHDLRVKRDQEQKERDGQTDEEISNQLKSFFGKLEKLTLPNVPMEKISLIEAQYQEISKTLEDETKETDLDIVSKKMEQVIQLHAPGSLTEKFDPNKHDSIMDYYSSFLEKAKLYPHRQYLLDLYNGWQTPGSKLTAMNVLAAIENVAFKEHLLKIFDLMEGNDMDPSTDTLDEHENDLKAGEGENEQAQEQQQIPPLGENQPQQS
jgi:hypothetical protein